MKFTYEDVYIRYYNSNYIKYILRNVFNYYDERIKTINSFLLNKLSEFNLENKDYIIKSFYDTCSIHDYYEDYKSDSNQKSLTQMLVEEIYFELDYDYDEIHTIVVDYYLGLNFEDVYNYLMKKINHELRYIKNKNKLVENEIRNGYKHYLQRVINEYTKLN